jgi:putative SOS response-associated peptidase YedK
MVEQKFKHAELRDVEVSEWGRLVKDYPLLHEKYARDFPALSDRIFPGSYAAITMWHDDRYYGDYMHYGTKSKEQVKSRLTTYNARMDNIASPFWSRAYLQGHGWLRVRSFFEWVLVKDLIHADKVSLAEVEQLMEKNLNQKKEKAQKLGKVFKLSATDKKPLLERSVMIRFYAPKKSCFYVPVIVEPMPAKAEIKDLPLKGFAIVTTDPPEEVEQAGHDRCPVVLDSEKIIEWSKVRSHQDAIEVLKSANHPRFDHELWDNL